MIGKIYKYPLPVGMKLCRWFISYEDKKHRYIEENFVYKRDAKMRITELAAKNIEAELWTRERVWASDRLL